MAGRKYIAEQIIAILRQIEVGTADGKTTLHLVALGERGQGTWGLERDLTLARPGGRWNNFRIADHMPTWTCAILSLG